MMQRCMLFAAAGSISSVSALAGEAPAISDTVTLNNGVKMPVVSLGTVQREFDNNATEMEQAIAQGVGAGLKGIDAAFNYFDQEAVGKAIKAVGRERLFVTTKTTPCMHPQAPPTYNITDVEACKAQTKKDVEADFSQLGIDKIDLLLLHGANRFGEGSCNKLACALNRAQWSVYEEFYRAGKVRAIGISNYCPSCIDCLLEGAQVVPAVLQNKYHVGMTSDPHGFVSYTLKKGILPMAYTPMGKASELLKDPLLKEIAEKHNKTTAQVALKWIVSQGFTLATASKTIRHIQEDLDLFSWNLETSEVERLDGYKSSSDEPSWACTAAEKDRENVYV
eukprot:TRINITY_DN5549_c0_g1_i1.p1 TRINITY_DN5549_c0_g1~~TRINITY_DN5549_c0_g1_i1.p1  ORF type:complete len:336 (+),score=67.78 TRINITY_DN5549_c0_g1_i1:81-1088(+)